MNYQDPPLHGQAKNVTYDYDRAAEEGARLQADPELASSEGRATLPAIAAYFTAMVFIVCVALYGLNNQRDETVTNASASAVEAPANNTGEAPPQQRNAPAGQQQGNNAANPQQGQNNQPPKQQSQDNQQPAQPQKNAEKPAAQQQNAPTLKQQ